MTEAMAVPGRVRNDKLLAEEDNEKNITNHILCRDAVRIGISRRLRGGRLLLAQLASGCA
jgi:hypothetical protein